MTLNIDDGGLIRGGGGGAGAGVSRDVGTSLQCLGIRSNNLLRNVWSRHSNAAVLSIRGADPSSHPLWDHCGSLWTSDRTGGILPVRTCHGTNKAQCDVVLITRWQRSEGVQVLLPVKSLNYTVWKDEQTPTQFRDVFV